MHNTGFHDLLGGQLNYETARNYDPDIRLSLVYGKRIAIQWFRRHKLVTVAIEERAGFLKTIQTIDNSFLLSQSTPRLLFYHRISSIYTYNLKNDSTKLGVLHTYKQASFYTAYFPRDPPTSLNTRSYGLIQTLAVHNFSQLWPEGAIAASDFAMTFSN